MRKYIKNKISKAKKIMHISNVAGYVKDGSFDYHEKRRIKPMTRLRRNTKELDLERMGSKKMKFYDWVKDIRTGYSKHIRRIR
jgi:hypothetical protein